MEETKGESLETKHDHRQRDEKYSRFPCRICFQPLQTLYGLADLFIIGWFDGVAGTTAVSIGSQVMRR
ncbi:MAG: hypothetical protein ACLS6G_13885 [Christensenellales bacterium]